MTPLLSLTLVSSAAALGGTTPAHRASKLALSHVAQPPLGQMETLKAPLVAAVSLGVVAELFCRKLQVPSSVPAYLLTASTFARLVSLQSQARAFLQANGSANGVWLTEQQWCWLTVLANGNGSGVSPPQFLPSGLPLSSRRSIGNSMPAGTACLPGSSIGIAFLMPRVVLPFCPTVNCL